MKILYAGQNLLLEDPACDLQRWVERYLSVNDLRLWGADSLALSDSQRNPRRDGAYKVSLPQVNWPEPPRLKLNSLWWPSGATRWARGLFMADGDAMQAIQQNLVGGAAELTIDDGDLSATFNHILLLTPHRLNGSPVDDLWLLPVVDVRWAWQFKEVTLSEAQVSTWGNLMLYLSAALGVSAYYGAADAAYLAPNPKEFTRAGANPAALLEAAVWSTGRRVSVWNDNEAAQGVSISILSPADSTEGETFNDYSDGLIAGGAFGLRYTAPEKVTVYFPRNKTPGNEDAVYPVSVTAASSGYPYDTMTGTAKIFYDTAAAEFLPSSGTPENDAELQALAEKTAADYYSYLRADYAYDFTFAGIKNWYFSGFMDYWWAHLGVQEPGGAYQLHTRVAALPDGVGVSEQLHGDPNASDEGPAKWVQVSIDTALTTSDETVAATVMAWWDGDDPDPDDAGLTVYNLPTQDAFYFAGDSGAIYYCRWDDELGHYRIVNGPHSGGAAAGLRWLKATSGWVWDVANQVGKVTGVAVDDIYGNNAGEDPITIYIPVAPKLDPNVQPLQIVPYTEDVAGMLIAGEGALDDKIGTIVEWDSLAPIPGGWREYTEQGGKFVVGRKAGTTDYETVGSTGGLHPIRPHEHSSLNTEPTVWKTDLDTGDWAENEWAIAAHDSLNLTSVSTGVTVDSGGPTTTAGTSLTIGGALAVSDFAGSTGNATVTVNDSAAGTTGTTGVTIDNETVTVNSASDHSHDASGDTDTATTSLTVTDYSGNSGSGGGGTASGNTASGTTGISVAAHPNHYHTLSDGTAISFQSGSVTTYVLENEGHTDEASEPYGSSLTHSVTDTGHTHSFSGITISAHTHTIDHGHSVGDLGHAHPINVGDISISSAGGHDHTTVAHTHTNTAHSHSTPVHGHTTTAHSHGVTHGHGLSGTITLSPDPHTHSITAHAHTVSETAHTHELETPLEHTGTLKHREEDFRPPYRVMTFIIRVGPDED